MGDPDIKEILEKVKGEKIDEQKAVDQDIITELEDILEKYHRETARVYRDFRRKYEQVLDLEREGVLTEASEILDALRDYAERKVDRESAYGILAMASTWDFITPTEITVALEQGGFEIQR